MKKLIVLLICAMIFLTACSAPSAVADSKSAMASAPPQAGAEEAVPAAPEEISEGEMDTAGGAGDFGSTPADANRKMTYNATFSINTTNYDADYGKIKAELASVNGYIENESSDATPPDGGRIYGRNSYFTLRVPVNEMDGFLERLSAIGEVTNKQLSANDVTDQYTDIDSRIAVLEARKARLMTHLQTATEIDDIISIEDQIADTIAELENLQGNKRSMDTQIDYVLVDVTLTEQITPETIGKDGKPLGDRASDAFAMSMAGVNGFWEGFAIFWAAALPVLIVIAIFAVATVLIVKLVRFLMKKYRAKHPKKVVPPPYRPQPPYTQQQQPMQQNPQYRQPPQAPPVQQMPPQNKPPHEEPKNDNETK